MVELTSPNKPKNRACSSQELFMAEVLTHTFPTADMRYENVVTKTAIGVTQPDFHFVFPDNPINVLLEVTTSKLCRHDEKREQRRVLRRWEQENPEFRWMILYLQHMASPKIVHTALNHLKFLAEGACSMEIQREMDNLAVSISPPTSIRWNRVYRHLTGEVYPHNDGADVIWTPKHTMALVQ